MQHKLKSPTLNSRRGRYNVVELAANPLIWSPRILSIDNPRHIAVLAEIRYAKEGRLADHPYWDNETPHFVLAYQNFYREIFALHWLHENDDRHNIVVNSQCCLTMIQYHNHKLIAYSRSTDMRNGYFSDKLILDAIAEHITKVRPDCDVREIEWYMAIPHVYENPGIARLLRKDEETT